MTPKDPHPVRTIDLDLVREIPKGTQIKVVLKDNDHVRPDSRGKEFVGEFTQVAPEQFGDSDTMMIQMTGKFQHMEEPDSEIFSKTVLYGFHDWLIESIETVD